MTVSRGQERVPRYTSYPTAPHFKPLDGTTHAQWLAEVPADAPVSLYLHVPFCAELCLYCGCHTTVARRYTPVAAYAELLLQEIELTAAALGGKRRLSHLHWGGGTPTILSRADLQKLMTAIRARFDVDANTEIAIEIDPRTFDETQAQTLGELGFTRASLGVQSFSPLVQETIKRRQSYDITEKSAQWLRAAGIKGINLDLMYGLPYQSLEDTLETIEMSLKLDPDRIALFGYAHVPWMKKHQALIPDESLPGPASREEQMLAASAAIVAAGYEAIGIDHFAKPQDAMARMQKAGSLRRNFQGYTTDDADTLIGLGTSAISRLPAGFVQNLSATPAYREAVEHGRLATARGLALSEDDKARWAVIERLMCDLAIDRERFAGSVADWPEEALETLAQEGILTKQGSRLVVPEDMRPLTRIVCASFDRYLASGAGRHSQAV